MNNLGHGIKYGFGLFLIILGLLNFIGIACHIACQDLHIFTNLDITGPYIKSPA